jgi:hypothetical protein
VLRSKMQPRSTIPCQHQALVGKSAHPRKTTDYEETGVPRHIAAIGAWNQGHRMDYDNQHTRTSYPLAEHHRVRLRPKELQGVSHDGEFWSSTHGADGSFSIRSS